jgi:hypothetical protein
MNYSILDLFRLYRGLITPVRVKQIILNDEDKERFKEVGEWNGIGTIYYQDLIKPEPTSPWGGQARPLVSNLKQFPLINEIVYLLNLPNTNITDKEYVSVPYYVCVLSLWNHPHHNAFPEQEILNTENVARDYPKVSSGAKVRRIEDAGSDIKLGSTFKEKPNIHPLLPYEGDVLLEGRWGNSIRLGSTVKYNESSNISNITKNNWSSKNNNGSPLLIIRNGQGEKADKNKRGWIPITEDITDDISSIYLTSNQSIPLKLSFELNKQLYSAFNLLGDPKNKIKRYQPERPPDDPEIYTQSQIILNSGRITLNAVNDHVIIGAQKSINLTSNQSIYLSSNNDIVFSVGTLDGTGANKGSKLPKGKILLGEDAVWSAVKGEILIEVLLSLCKSIETLGGVLSVESSLATAGTLVQGPARDAKNLQEVIKLALTSKTNFIE